jgi:pimeloyl-ACP methyl ester carboxylesterase
MAHQTGFRVTRAATRPGMPSGAIEMQRLRLRARGLVFDTLATGPPTGEPVVLLHGFPQTAACWIRVAQALAAVGYRVLAPDQRGYSPGARPAAVRAYRMPELVADVLALAEAAGAARFHLVGHDWGGAVAWTLAGRHPERVATLTSVSTPHPRALAAALLTGGQLLRSAYIGFFRIPRLPELVLGARGSRGLRFLLARSGLGPAWAERYARALAEPGALSAALAWYRAAVPFGMAVPRVSVPTRYVWGSGDPALGRRAATTTGRWVAGPYRLDVLEGAGHWLPEHHPEELAKLFLEHLAVASVRSLTGG